MDNRFGDSDDTMLQVTTSSPFFGRAQNLLDIRAWLNSPHSPSQIISISGIGGIGKTTLMTEMAKVCRDASVKVVWLDGRTFVRRPADFLSGIEMILEQEYGAVRSASVSTLDHIIQFFSAHRSVVFIDNCEELLAIEGWLLSRFMPQLPQQNHLLVIASRTGLPISWRTNPNLHGFLRTLTLDVFATNEAKDYLSYHKIPHEIIESIIIKTQCFPLSLALAVDTFHSQNHENAIDIIENIPNLISAEILEEVTSPSVFEALQILSILSDANFADIQELIPAFQISNYRELGHLSFVRTNGHELSMHDVVASVLRHDFKTRDGDGFRANCKRAMMHLINQYPHAEKRTQMRIAEHFLTLFLELTPVRYAYADFSSDPRFGENRGFEMDDLPHLHRILEGAMARDTWQCELIASGAHHALLDDIATNCPEGIRVVRSETGIPLALGAAIWLRADTVPLFEKYTPRFISEVLGNEVDALRSTPEECADSFCVLLSAVDMEHPVYRPEVLGVLSFLDWYNVVSNGARSIVPTSNPDVIHLSTQFGYRKTNQLPNQDSEDDIVILEWDFRDEKFPVWARTMLAQTAASATSRETMEHGSQTRSTVPLDPEEMRHILKNLHRIEVLNDVPFTQAAGLSGFELQQRVQGLLTCEPPTMPMTEQDQSVLLAAFSQRHVGKAILAETLNVSRTTLYRYTRSAAANLAQALASSLA